MHQVTKRKAQSRFVELAGVEQKDQHRNNVEENKATTRRPTSEIMEFFQYSKLPIAMCTCSFHNNFSALAELSV